MGEEVALLVGPSCDAARSRKIMAHMMLDLPKPVLCIIADYAAGAELPRPRKKVDLVAISVNCFVICAIAAFVVLIPWAIYTSYNDRLDG
jgi:hypothetical protein